MTIPWGLVHIATQKQNPRPQTAWHAEESFTLRARLVLDQARII